MLSLSLARTVRGSGITKRAPGLSLILAVPLRRWIFNPSLTPPPSGPVAYKEFPLESRAHISPSQFETVRSHAPPDAFAGLADGVEPLSEKFKAMTPEQIWASRAPKSVISPPGIFVGRSVSVGKDGIDSAWNRLQSILRQNNVKRELRAAERHEKKGCKRRRLRSERWKRKFADEVRKKVKLVTEIRLRDRMWGARH